MISARRLRPLQFFPFYRVKAVRATLPPMPPKKPKQQAAKAEEPVVSDDLASTDKTEGTKTKEPAKAKRSRSTGAAEAEPKAGTEGEAETAAPVRRTSTGGGPAVTEESILEGTTEFKRATKDADFDPHSMLKMISWNVAGLRAMVKKDDAAELRSLVAMHKPDVVCLQETKLSADDGAQVHASLAVLPGYKFVDSISSAKKGYSGTRTYVRDGIAVSHSFGFDISKPTHHDAEGRVLTSMLKPLGSTSKPTIAIVNSYVPNAGMTLERLDYRVQDYDPIVRAYLKTLSDTVSAAAPESAGGVIWTGDLNVAERDYDRYFTGTYKQMQKCPGFTPEERQSFRTTLQEAKMVDGFRHLYPTAAKAYTFWSFRFNQRAKNNGWRLDYFVMSAALASRIVECCALPEYTSSDHCPLMLWLRK